MAIGLAVLGFFFLDAAVVEACPNCKDTLAHNGGRMQYGYALSILLMIAAPFAILTGWFIAIRRMLRLPHTTLSNHA